MYIPRDQTTIEHSAPPAAVSEPPVRKDFEAIRRAYGDVRSEDRIRAHYVLERSLAARLSRSSRKEREAGLYTELYDVLLSQLPDHPRKALGDEAIRTAARRQIKLLRARLANTDRFLEIGAGACQVALGVAPHVAEAIAIDVTDELAPKTGAPDNFRFLRTKGVSIPLPDRSVSFAYSNQLMEHLHPDDAEDQLRDIWRILTPGGRYFCRTPSKYTGPHDVSKYFSDHPEGMHIKEYGYRDLASLFRKTGFRKVGVELTPAGIDLGRMPVGLAAALERTADALTTRFRRRIARTPPIRAVMGVSMMAIK